jgi:L-ascorbate metabolism protein UlaG (beta-lactamase superfamily)
VDLALVTHLHLDHADPTAIGRAVRPGGTVLRPAIASGDRLEVAAVQEAEKALAASGLEVRVVEPWDTVAVGDLRASAVPAADGTGDPQVGWVVELGGARLFHGGDTLFHGWWWRIAMRAGPIDVAFLPVNGAVIDLPHRQPPSPLPAALTADQAAVAAALLRARLAVPIHFDTFARAPHYLAGVGDDLRFARACARMGVEARVLAPGEELTATADQAA